MTHSKIPVAQSIVALCLSKDITQVVISPGSRNAPLTIEFTNNPNVKAYSIVDERCAAFFALGIAQQSKQPVALVCTSGSALLNYYPAVAEAFYSDIPLVVLSADRPIERIDIGDGQTIRQRNVFANHILYSANLYSGKVPIEAVADQKSQQKLQESQRLNEKEINKALNTAIVKQGPVHINVPFYEPLYETTDHITISPIKIDPKIQEHHLSLDKLEELKLKWSSAKRILILVGVCSPESIHQDILENLGTAQNVIVFTETTSNLNHPNFFTRIDNLIGSLEEKDFEKLQPEILITFGGMVVSKKIKAFLRAYQPQEHWHIDTKKAYDTFFCLKEHIVLSPDRLFHLLLKGMHIVSSNYQKDWLAVRKDKDTKHSVYIDKMPWSDFKAFSFLLPDIPKHTLVQVGNSSAIRYIQLFKINKTLEIYCNRGTSGIDGSTSTAIGAAVARAKPVVFITGDLSFFYDSNALWNAYTPSNFKIILINNNGGGIFRILPNQEKESENFDTYFETIHSLNAKHLCQMYDWNYFSVKSEKEYVQVREEFYNTNNKPTLLEIGTRHKTNDKVLLEYFDFIK